MRLLSQAIIIFIVWLIIRVSYYYLVLKLPDGMRLRFHAPQRPICKTSVSLLAPLRGAFRKLRRFWLSPKTAFVCSNRPAPFLAARPPPLSPCFVYGNNFPLSTL